MRTIHRYEVPLDDQWHQFKLHGDPLHVNTRKPGVVEFWAWSRTDPNEGRGGSSRSFRVFGTGHPMPAEVRYWGTVLDGPFVWHLLEDG